MFSATPREVGTGSGSGATPDAVCQFGPERRPGAFRLADPGSLQTLGEEGLAVVGSQAGSTTQGAHWSLGGAAGAGCVALLFPLPLSSPPGVTSWPGWALGRQGGGGASQEVGCAQLSLSRCS